MAAEPAARRRTSTICCAQAPARAGDARDPRRGGRAGAPLQQRRRGAARSTWRTTAHRRRSGWSRRSRSSRGARACTASSGRCATRRRPSSPDGDAWEDGPWAVPAAYKLVLTVDGQRLEQPLEVRPDPRVELTARPTPSSSRWRGRSTRCGRRSRRRGRRRPRRALARSSGSRRRREPAARSWPRCATKVAEVAGVTMMSNPSNAWAFPPRRHRQPALRAQRARRRLPGGAGSRRAAERGRQGGLAAIAPMTRAALAAWRELVKRASWRRRTGGCGARDAGDRGGAAAVTLAR